ncbi:YjfB family protein [Parachitinimonas caeni]|uniref:YjfB family protein n=1 Tax=Parachitinimonas caeni TaxID=3031301 RepID=A0ABT7DUX8_9NEIS|nr:YjfB family protein [Parachitinimonas caeni]MDK2123872.1 YjfB family protein [Parachitinimonas caeni]
MDITALSNAASNAQAQQSASVFALKKALDLQKEQTATLLQSVTQGASNPPNLGNSIDVRA